MMAKPVGDQSVFAALAETLPSLETIDLEGTVPPAARPSVIEVSGRYSESGELGRGGLGVVLEVFDHDLRRAVALKRPRDELLDPRHIGALIKEAQVTAQLEHPNIPAVHALGIDSAGRPYFVMTRLRGQTLVDVLRDNRGPDGHGTITTARLLRIFLQVAYSVAYAHSRGVLHRDLKPGNVFIGEFGDVRLVDWGLARLIDRPDDARPGTDAEQKIDLSGDPVQTQEGEILGTPGYASPEQMKGAVAEIDERTDIYSLGVMLYEMLAGRLPVGGETVTGLIGNTIAGKTIPLRSVAPVDKRLAAVVHKALALEPSDRYPDVVGMIADVEAYLEGRPVSVVHEDVLHRVGRWYMHRTPRTARLKNIDIDTLSWGAFMGGVACGLGLAFYVAESLYTLLCVIFGVLAIAACIPAVYTLLRKPRPEDPGAHVPPSIAERVSKSEREPDDQRSR
jgi:serine/threonine-protein kinase